MGDFLSELVRLAASSDSALSELVLDVEKDAGQTNGKCARLGPIDAGKMLFLATGVIDFQVAVLCKAKSGKSTLPFRKVERINGRVANRHRRIFRVDVYGS